MRPTDEKIRAMVHAAVGSLGDAPGVTVKDKPAALQAVRTAVAEVLAIDAEIHSAVRDKIESLSRRVTPGTREYADLFARYSADERRRRGL